MDVNLELRKKILEFSLKIENGINDLLLGHLQIFDKKKTKNFGNKAGISFKNKIDLLYDIGVLEPEEHKNLELLMNFRNKFMHDLDSNSFSYVVSNFDNGIKNRLLKFIEKKKEIDEKDYELAFENLFLHNMKVILDKYKARRESIIDRTNYLTSLFDAYLSMNDLASNLLDNIMKIVEGSELENPLIMKILNPIMDKCLDSCKLYELESKKVEQLSIDFEKLPKNKMLI